MDDEEGSPPNDPRRERGPGADPASLSRAIEANAITFTDSQRSSIRDAFFDAEVALLRRITGEAERLEGYESARNLSSLINALQGLRAMAAQSPGPAWPRASAGWFGCSPISGEIYDPDEDV